jgi:hypothetical protein
MAMQLIEVEICSGYGALHQAELSTQQSAKERVAVRVTAASRTPHEQTVLSI